MNARQSDSMIDCRNERMSEQKNDRKEGSDSGLVILIAPDAAPPRVDALLNPSTPRICLYGGGERGGGGFKE